MVWTNCERMGDNAVPHSGWMHDFAAVKSAGADEASSHRCLLLQGKKEEFGHVYTTLTDS